MGPVGDFLEYILPSHEKCCCVMSFVFKDAFHNSHDKLDNPWHRFFCHTFETHPQTQLGCGSKKNMAYIFSVSKNLIICCIEWIKQTHLDKVYNSHYGDPVMKQPVHWNVTGGFCCRSSHDEIFSGGQDLFHLGWLHLHLAWPGFAQRKDDGGPVDPL